MSYSYYIRNLYSLSKKLLPIHESFISIKQLRTIFNYSSCVIYEKSIHKQYSNLYSSYISKLLKPYFYSLIIPFDTVTKHRYSNKKKNVESFNIYGHIADIKGKKRVPRKKRDIEINGDKEFPIIAYATADEYDLNNFLTDIKYHGDFIHTNIVIHNENASLAKNLGPKAVIQLEPTDKSVNGAQKMYVFSEGVSVFWNVSGDNRRRLIDLLNNHETNSYKNQVIADEMETLAYKYSELSTRIRESQDLILLEENGQTDLEKYTISNVLAQSVKLGIWESSFDNYVDSIEHISEELSLTGRIKLNRNEVLQKLGQLFSLQHKIKLQSDLLDIPDFYWDHKDLEDLYKKTANYLSIHKRTSVLTMRISHCIDLMGLLKSDLNERHSSRLEWIIIILIMIEVFFEILHYKK